MIEPTPALELRTRTPTLPDESHGEADVPVEAFAQPRPRALRLMELDELALRPGHRPGPRKDDLEAMAVFMFASLGEIPSPTPASAEVPSRTAETSRESIRAWRLVPTMPGYLVFDRGRGIRIAAAALPLMTMALPAHAAPGQGAGAAGGTADDTVVTAPSAAEDPEPSAPAPAPAQGHREATGATSQTKAEAPPTLSLTGDAVWAGLLGQDVILKMSDGNEIHGRVLGQAGDQFAFGRATDGLVVSVPKAQVRTIRIDFDQTNLGADAPNPDQKGIGMLTAGIILTTVGVPLVIAGTTFLAISPSFLPLHLPMIVPGTAMVSAGIPLTVNGFKRRKAWKAAYGRGTASISPALDLGPRGFSGGVRLRF